MIESIAATLCLLAWLTIVIAVYTDAKRAR